MMVQVRRRSVQATPKDIPLGGALRHDAVDCIHRTTPSRFARSRVADARQACLSHVAVSRSIRVASAVQTRRAGLGTIACAVVIDILLARGI